MKLVINGKLAEREQAVTTSSGRTGKLKHWTLPNTSHRYGRVYVILDGDQAPCVFMPSAIGGTFK
jgi:hypothetical protein